MGASSWSSSSYSWTDASYKKKAESELCRSCYYCGVKKLLTITELARMGGKARAAKLSAERRKAIASGSGKKGRPRPTSKGVTLTQDTEHRRA
jgi:hypothetical protein